MQQGHGVGRGRPAVPFRPALVAVWAIGTTAVVVGALALTEGSLVFSIDDPMIHLALAEHLAHGHHGVNPGEVAAPSSSILWPWLLVVPEAMGFGVHGALLLALAAQGAAVWILAQQVSESIDTTWLRWAVGLIGLVLVNGFGLPMTGMEHSLHVLAALATVRGLLLLDREQHVGWWLEAAIVVQALVRYEGLALSGLAIAWLWWRGHRRRAAGAATGIALPLAAHVAWMAHLGLPLLPSSVLLKSQQLQGASTGLMALLGSVVGNIAEGFAAVTGIGLVAAVVFLGAVALGWTTPSAVEVPSRGLLGALALGILAHVLFGAWDWFSRYEVYAVGVALMAVLPLLGPALDRMRRPRQVIALQLLVLFAVPFAVDIVLTPTGARSMHEQQFQMHRIATALDAPVGVNDLGHVSHGNDNYVLDLWGLASEDVRRAQLSGGLSAELTSRLARAHDIDLVMAYDGWIPEVPGWMRVATLHTSDVTVGDPVVELTATSKEAVPEVTRAIATVESSLPPGATIIWDVDR